MWDIVKNDMDYPDTDNNNGYIFGVNWLENEEIIEVTWYRTEKERQQEIKKAGYEITN